MRRISITKTNAIGAAVFVLYVALMIVAQIRHEPWRDEIHCWMVGRNGQGLLDILTGERRYDGHPFLWYWLIHWVSKVWYAPEGMQAFTVLLTAVSAWLVLFRSPFALYERVLLLFSYYFVYEYAVICRSYVVGLLLVCTFCAVYDPRRVRYVTLSAILAAMVAVSAYNALVAGALALYLFGHHLAVEQPADRRSFVQLTVPKLALVGLALFVAGGLFVAITTVPPPDAYFDNPVSGLLDKNAFQQMARRFLVGLAPIPPSGTVNVWNHGFNETLPPESIEWIAWAGAALFFAWVVALARRPFLALPFVVGSVVIALFQNYKYEGAIRHWGHFSLLLVACVWLSRKASASPRKPWIYSRVLFAATMLVQVYCGARVLAADIKGPFSGAEATADFIIRQGLRDEPFVGTADHPVSAVAGYLERDFTWPETGEVGQTVVFHSRRTDASTSALFKNALAVAEKTKKSPILVTNYPVLLKKYRGATIEPLYDSPTAIVDDETFHVYRFTPPAKPEAEPEPGP